MDLFACEGEEHAYGGNCGHAIAHMRAHKARENSTRLGRADRRRICATCSPGPVSSRRPVRLIVRLMRLFTVEFRVSIDNFLECRARPVVLVVIVQEGLEES